MVLKRILMKIIQFLHGVILPYQVVVVQLACLELITVNMLSLTDAM